MWPWVLFSAKLLTMRKVDLRRYIENELYERLQAAEHAYRQAKALSGSADAGASALTYRLGACVEHNPTEAYRLALQNFSQFLLYQKLPPPEYLLLPLLEQVVEATHASFGNIQVFDESRQVLKLAANCGFDRPFLEFFATVADERGASCGAALKAARRVIVADVRESPFFAGTPSLEVLLRAGVMACQSTPLVGPEGTLIGMLNTHYRAPMTPSKSDCVLIDELASPMAALLAASTT